MGIVDTQRKSCDTNIDNVLCPNCQKSNLGIVFKVPIKLSDSHGFIRMECPNCQHLYAYNKMFSDGHNLTGTTSIKCPNFPATVYASPVEFPAIAKVRNSHNLALVFGIVIGGAILAYLFY